eukprot:2153782-Pyramimonas_sp.AAC.1
MSKSSWKRRFPKKTSSGLCWGVVAPTSALLSLGRSFLTNLRRGPVGPTQPRSASTTCGERRAEERGATATPRGEGRELRQDDGLMGEG